MSRHKPKFKPKVYENVPTGSNLSAVLYASMLQSENWLKLSHGAKVTYLYMKLQLYGARPIAEHPKEHFYFNDAMATKVYKICSNRTQCRKYRNELIQYGFIELVEYRAHTFDKNIYTFSDKWQTGNEYPLPQVLLTVSERAKKKYEVRNCTK